MGDESTTDAAGSSPAAEDLEEIATSPADEAGEVATETVEEEEAEQFEIDLELLLREREEYLDALRRVQADFENYKKRIRTQQNEQIERASGQLVEKLLPVLDTFDLALAHGAADLDPIYRSLLGALESEGLERLDPSGKPFDPNEHEAVAHDPDGDDGHDGPVVAEVFRAGYRWKGRVLRPAMVKVRG